MPFIQEEEVGHDLGVWEGLQVVPGVWKRVGVGLKPSATRIRAQLGGLDQLALKLMPRMHPNSDFNDPHMYGKLKR